MEVMREEMGGKEGRMEGRVRKARSLAVTMVKP